MPLTKIVGPTLSTPPTAELVVGHSLGPNPYATGGFAADIVADLGISAVDGAVVHASAGYTAAWDSAAKKIIAYSTAATEVGAGVDLSAVRFTITAWNQ
jgi:hypothetical protein